VWHINRGKEPKRGLEVTITIFDKFIVIFAQFLHESTGIFCFVIRVADLRAHSISPHLPLTLWHELRGQVALFRIGRVYSQKLQNDDTDLLVLCMPRF